MRFLLCLGLVAGCGDDDEVADGDADADTDADSDADADTDADADADGDTDGDADGDGDGQPDPYECSRGDEAWIFCEDFEGGDLSAFDDYDGNPPETNSILEDAGPFALTGNHVTRLYPPPGRGGADLVKVLAEPDHDVVYARWWVQYEPGFDFTAPNHGGGLHAGARDWLGHSDTRPAGDDWFSAWLEYDPSGPFFYAYTYYRGMYQDCADPYGACWGDHFPCTADEGETYCERAEDRERGPLPTIEAGRWSCLEEMLGAGTPVASEDAADGQLDFWVDGQEIGPWPDLWLRTTADLHLSILWLSLFHHAEHADAGERIDNVVVSTERIGCGGAVAR